MLQMKKLAIIVTHPVQYYAPVFQLLHQRQRLDIKVFYTWGIGAMDKYDPGFQKNIEWDIPLFEGYPYEWVENKSNDTGSHHFEGIINPGLIDHVCAFKPDALLVYGWAYNSHLKALRYFKNKIPVFFRGDSTLLDERGGIKALVKTIFLKWVYRHIDHAFYVGTNNKNYFKKYGLRDEQLTFAPHAVDNNRFSNRTEADVQLLRTNLRIKDNQCLILYAGKLEEKKDPVLLLNAFMALNEPDIHLIFIGNGKLETVLKNKAAGRKDVHFMDFQNQSRMPMIYQACDIFCLPSCGPGETWGLSINEAMASGMPILASDKVGSSADLVKPGVNGAIFKSGSEADLSRHLRELINKNKAGLAIMGQRSRDLIKNWSFEAQVQVIETKVQNG